MVYLFLSSSRRTHLHRLLQVVLQPTVQRTPVVDQIFVEVPIFTQVFSFLRHISPFTCHIGKILRVQPSLAFFFSSAVYSKKKHLGFFFTGKWKVVTSPISALLAGWDARLLIVKLDFTKKNNY